MVDEGREPLVRVICKSYVLDVFVFCSQSDSITFPLSTIDYIIAVKMGRFFNIALSIFVASG